MSKPINKESPGAGNPTRPIKDGKRKQATACDKPIIGGGKGAPKPHIRRRVPGKGKITSGALLDTVQELQGQLDARRELASEPKLTLAANSPLSVQSPVVATSPTLAIVPPMAPTEGAIVPATVPAPSEQGQNLDEEPQPELPPGAYVELEQTVEGTFHRHGGFEFPPELVTVFGLPFVIAVSLCLSFCFLSVVAVDSFVWWFANMPLTLLSSVVIEEAWLKIWYLGAAAIFDAMLIRLCWWYFATERTIVVRVAPMLPIDVNSVPPTAGTSAAKPTVPACLFPIEISMQWRSNWVVHEDMSFMRYFVPKCLKEYFPYPFRRTAVIDYHRVTNTLDEMSGSCKPLYSSVLEKCKTAVSVKHLSLMHPVVGLTYASVTQGSAIYCWLRMMQESGKTPSEVIEVFRDFDNRNFAVRPSQGV